MKLGVIVPSRGRPQAMAELVEAFDATCRADTRLICRVDDDDDLDAYRAAAPGSLFVGPRVGLGASINEMAATWVDKVDCLGFMGDDHRPRTVGWDERILSVIEKEPLGVVYGDDLLQGRNLASQVFMGSELVRRLGWFNPPGIKHMYIDNFWMTLGTNLGTLQFLEDVVIEHMHPIAGKAEWDAGYREVNAQAVYDADRAAFDAYLRTDLLNDLIRVTRR
jgi:hypothetical protein